MLVVPALEADAVVCASGCEVGSVSMAYTKRERFRTWVRALSSLLPPLVWNVKRSGADGADPLYRDYPG